MEVEALKVDIHNVLDQFAIFRKEDRQRRRSIGGIGRRDDAITAHGDEYPLINIMLECFIVGITSGYEAMGTNGDIFPVEWRESELEILHDIRGNTKALCKRLEDINKNRILALRD